MHPFEFLGKPREIACRGNCTGRSTANIGNVGKVALELLLVFLVQRQAPGAIVYRLASTQYICRQRLIVGKQSADHMPERNDAGAGERSNVDYRRWIVAFGVGQRIAQYQAALGIGIEDFNRQPRHAGDDVPRLGGTTARHVFGGGNDAHHIDR